MPGKSTVLAAALTAALVGGAGPVLADNANVEILHGQTAATAVSSNQDQSRAGVTVVRGSTTFVPATPVSAGPTAFIDGEQIDINGLEPANDWFLDRSGERLVVVHCYTRQSVLVGEGRRILCTARQF